MQPWFRPIHNCCSAQLCFYWYILEETRQLFHNTLQREAPRVVSVGSKTMRFCRETKEGLAARERQGLRPSRGHTERCWSNVRVQIQRSIHSCTAVTLAIYRCSLERDLKRKSQEAVTRNSTEGRQMKGAPPWTGTARFSCWSPTVPHADGPFPAASIFIKAPLCRSSHL